jgi:hypothetical protein
MDIRCLNPLYPYETEYRSEKPEARSERTEARVSHPNITAKVQS